MRKTGLRYIAYVRKSEERTERQELSHRAQVDAIKRQYPELNIVKWLEPESQSAFKPGRPISNEMMTMIDEGKADAIISWHPNRLARNELDAARVTYALRGPLKDLKFCSYSFDNTPEGILMLQFIMSQSQYESVKLGKDVRRGMKTKAAGGERPGRVWPGYKKVPVLDANGQPIIRQKDNKVVTRTDKDSKRYCHIELAWNLLLLTVYRLPRYAAGLIPQAT